MLIKRFAAAFGALIVCVAAAQAGPLALVVYGDSLSDNGNVFKATGFPPPPYYAGRLSNGPVAVEDLASMLHASLLDFAWGGATTGVGNSGDNGTATTTGFLSLPGMQPIFQSSFAQVAPIASTSLFVVWGGADDFFAPSPADANPQATANRAIANLVGMVTTLQSMGAAQVIVPGLPDLGLTPRLLGQGQAAAAQASAVTAYFNAALQAQLPAGVTYFDTSALLHQIVANPGAFGFMNVSDACLSTIPCLNPDQYVFWDGIHPTAHTHEILAERLAAVAVPEPASWGLALAGFALLAGKRLRRRDGPQS